MEKGGPGRTFWKLCTFAHEYRREGYSLEMKSRLLNFVILGTNTIQEKEKKTLIECIHLSQQSVH